jgi:caffeoyl-CoA O-methyltransferase
LFEPFDLVFIDADKASAADYFAWALKLTRRGSLIVTDNVVRNGAVIDADSADANVHSCAPL